MGPSQSSQSSQSSLSFEECISEAVQLLEQGNYKKANQIL